MASSKKTMNSGKAAAGGIKGFIQRAGNSFYAGGMWAKDWAFWTAKQGGKFGFIIATTTFVTLLPLIYEISRETQVSRLNVSFYLHIIYALILSFMLFKMLEVERAQVKDLKEQGYTDRQLQELGFCEASYRQPSVAAMK